MSAEIYRPEAYGLSFCPAIVILLLCQTTERLNG